MLDGWIDEWIDVMTGGFMDGWLDNSIIIDLWMDLLIICWMVIVLLDGYHLFTKGFMDGWLWMESLIY